MKSKGQPTGASRAGLWWLKLIFITQVPGACAWESMCAFKPTKAWAEQKNGISRIICMTPPVLWNFKELQCPACFYLPQGKGTREFFHSACSSRCALKGGKMWEVWFPQCFMEACICPDIAHLCTPRRPASLQPSVLMHYRSSRHRGKCLAKAACYFPPMLIFIQGCLSHATLEGCNATSVRIGSVQLQTWMGSLLDKRDTSVSYSASFVPFLQLKELRNLNFNKSEVTQETFLFRRCFFCKNMY